MLKLKMTQPPLPGFLSAQPDGVLLAVKLQPRASKNEIVGALGNELRIKVMAPPVDAAANEALVRLLAEWLECPRGKVELVRGHTSRHKTIKLHGVEAAVVAAKLTSCQAALPAAEPGVPARRRKRRGGQGAC